MDNITINFNNNKDELILANNILIDKDNVNNIKLIKNSIIKNFLAFSSKDNTDTQAFGEGDYIVYFYKELSEKEYRAERELSTSCEAAPNAPVRAEQEDR